MTKTSRRRTHKQVVLVTGVETKLAYELAKTYALRKMKVIVQSDAENSGLILDLLVHDIVSQGGTAVPSYHPIHDTTGIMKDIKNHFNQIDVLIVRVPEKTDYCDWKSDYEHQLQIVYRLVHNCMEYFQNQQFGRIVFITSHQGILNSSSITFNAAKFALLGLCRSVSAVGKTNNISCNVLLAENINEMDDYEKNEREIEMIINLTKSHSTETGSILSSRDEISCLKEYTELQPLAVPLNDEVLKGHVAVVTGASSGIGFHLAKMLLKMGASVVAFENNMMRQWSRPNFEQNKVKRRSINLLSTKRNQTVKSSKLDYIDFMNESQLIEFAIQRYGRIDILFITSTVPVAPRHSELHAYSWDLMLRCRLESAYNLSQLVLPIMQKQRYGRIVSCGPNLCCESIRYGLIGLSNGISNSLPNFKHDLKTNSLFVDDDGKFDDGNVAAFLACQLIVPATPFQNQSFNVRNASLVELQFQYHPYSVTRNHSASYSIQINNTSNLVSTFDSMANSENSL